MRAHPLLLALALVCGCGGSTAAQPDPSSPASPAASTAPAASDAAPAPAASADAAPAPATGAASFPLPTACADKGADVCTPPSGFVERLCARPHQDAALALFAKSAPFTHLYLRGKMDELAWDEEVLALRYHGVPKNGMQIGGANGSYDVLRWDGSCSMAVDADILTRNRPPRPRSARVQWHRLSDKVQTALVAQSDGVKKAHARRGKECQGAMTGDVSAGCERADAALVDAVVEYVRGGGAVPAGDVY